MKYQAKQEVNGRTVSRWYVHTDKGRKVTWAATDAEARARAERVGLMVTSVVAAKSLLDEATANASGK